ncbi:MAG: outer membrane protein assembly factor BamA, partial [Saprospiraceae bacterium]|nr:outer membrane protein assembly factor BamA [Saprospiraceae bacterium]
MSKKHLLWLVGQLLCLCLAAQPADQPVDPETYEIGGVRISGNENSEPAMLLTVAGLRVGDRIRLPGPETTKALKNLLKLGLFSDVQILREKSVGDIVFLEIAVQEQDRLSGHGFRGVPKSRQDDLNEKLAGILLEGRILSEKMQTDAITAIQDFYTEKGFANVSVTALKEPGRLEKSQRIVFDIEEGKKVPVQDIVIHGNNQVSTRKLLKIIPVKTKRKFWKASRFLPEAWAEGQNLLLQYYRSLGFLDAKIEGDSVFRNQQGRWELQLRIAEGRRYFFGDIAWSGNSKYDDQSLGKLLGIKSGEVYNAEKLEQRLRFSESGDDITSLYMDDGHLFFQIYPEITDIRGDTVDVEILLSEGPVAIVDKVIIKGNDRTKEHVIRRELYTEPGKQFSRSDIIRSQRQIASLGYFNPETIGIKPIVNPERGTVDVEYTVEESNTGQQFELSAGWGGSGIGITGTMGVTLNNFSLKGLFDRSSWNPLPSGDGQSLSFRVQSNGSAYQSYNVSFTEPWLGGKRPNSLSFASFYNRYTNGLASSSEGFGLFSLMGSTVSFASRLRFPDDNFVSSTALNFQRYGLENWTTGLFQTDAGVKVTDGNFYNINFRQTLARNTINQPIFPTHGSKVSLSVALTPPWSLFSGKENPQLIEYHKWRFDAEFYTPITKKMVLKASAKLGYLGTYNRDLGASPFERFQLGGDAMSNSNGGYTGTDLITLRGYDVGDLENNFLNGNLVATPIFNKFTVELRYPLSLNPSATIYALMFAEAGNS